MLKKPLEALEEHFNKVTDPRMDRTKEHKLIDMIAIAIGAVICRAEDWTDIENFGNSKLSWLKSCLELPNGTLLVTSRFRSHSPHAPETTFSPAWHRFG